MLTGAPGTRDAQVVLSAAAVRSSGAPVDVAWRGFDVPDERLVTYSIAVGSAEGSAEYQDWQDARVELDLTGAGACLSASSEPPWSTLSWRRLFLMYVVTSRRCVS